MQKAEGSSHTKTTLQNDKQVVEAEIGPIQPQDVRRSSRAKNQPIIVNDYGRFPNQAIRENSDLLEEVRMVESEPIDHDQAMKDENWQDAMNGEIKPKSKE